MEICKSRLVDINIKQIPLHIGLRAMHAQFCFSFIEKSHQILISRFSVKRDDGDDEDEEKREMKKKKNNNQFQLRK